MCSSDLGAVDHEYVYAHLGYNLEMTDPAGRHGARADRACEGVRRCASTEPRPAGALFLDVYTGLDEARIEALAERVRAAWAGA